MRHRICSGLLALPVWSVLLCCACSVVLHKKVRDVMCHVSHV